MLDYVGREETVEMIGIVDSGLVYIINGPNPELLFRIPSAAGSNLERHDLKAGLVKLIAAVAP